MTSTALRNRYIIPLALGFIAYGGGLVAYNLFFHKLTGGYKWLLFLLPTIPILFVAHTIIRSVNLMDEMVRKMIIESMAFSGVATGFTCFSLLFAGELSGKPIPIEWAFYLMWLYYGVGALLNSRRYR